MVRNPLHSLIGHTIDAAKIAAIGDGNAQILYIAVILIQHGETSFLNVPFKRDTEKAGAGEQLVLCRRKRPLSALNEGEKTDRISVLENSLHGLGQSIELDLKKFRDPFGHAQPVNEIFQLAALRNGHIPLLIYRVSRQTHGQIYFHLNHAGFPTSATVVQIIHPVEFRSAFQRKFIESRNCLTVKRDFWGDSTRNMHIEKAQPGFAGEMELSLPLRMQKPYAHDALFAFAEMPGQVLYAACGSYGLFGETYYAENA